VPIDDVAAEAPPPAPPDVPAETDDDERTAEDVKGAPVPGAESGRVDGTSEGTSPLRALGQLIMLPPRLAWLVVTTPVRELAYVNERHRIYDRMKGVWFNDEGTIGLYPTLRLQSGFGATVGGRFVHRDVFGHKEKLSFYAGYGGRYREIAQGEFKTGRLFGDRFRLEATGEYEQRPRERFYGLGNNDTGPPPETLLDPTMTDIAVETRYRQRLARAALTADLKLVGPLSVRASGALTDVTVGDGERGPGVAEVYMTDSLAGWNGERNAYGELELRFDSRRAASRFESAAMSSAGSLLGVYGGRVHRLDPGMDFWRYGFDAQQFIMLGAGPRVLVLRAHGEAVSAPRGEVPFVELPELGRNMYLRGYPTERFRDRVAGAASLEYQWDLLRMLTASTFVDAGRVYPSLDELSLADLRVGYGASLSWYSTKSLRLRFSVATSIDGGLFLDLSFDPVTDLDGRVEQR
jgi:hypothetical protein